MAKKTIEQEETQVLLESMYHHYNNGEAIDAELAVRCNELIKEDMEKGQFNAALNKVVEFYGKYIDVSYSAKMLVDNINLKIIRS